MHFLKVEDEALHSIRLLLLIVRMLLEFNGSTDTFLRCSLCPHNTIDLSTYICLLKYEPLTHWHVEPCESSACYFCLLPVPADNFSSGFHANQEQLEQKKPVRIFQPEEMLPLTSTQPHLTLVRKAGCNYFPRLLMWKCLYPLQVI